MEANALINNIFWPPETDDFLIHLQITNRQQMTPDVQRDGKKERRNNQITTIKLTDKERYKIQNRYILLLQYYYYIHINIYIYIYTRAHFYISYIITKLLQQK